MRKEKNFGPGGTNYKLITVTAHPLTQLTHSISITLSHPSHPKSGVGTWRDVDGKYALRAENERQR